MSRALIVIALAGCMNAAPGTTSEAVINGTADSTDTAVMLLVVRTDTDRIGICTASLVAPRVLLTAAHCLLPETLAEGGPIPQQLAFGVFPGEDVAAITPSSLLAVSEVHPHPDFNDDLIEAGNDVGVVILESPIGITPIAVNTAAIGRSQLGQSTRVVGYGLAVPSDDASVGRRRQATLRLTGVSSGLLELSAPRLGLCEGDSGGPALMKRNGTERIVGVASFRSTICSAATPVYSSRVDTELGFLQTFLDQPLEPASVPEEAGGGGCSTVPHPTRAPLALLLLVALSQYFIRRSEQPVSILISSRHAVDRGQAAPG